MTGPSRVRGWMPQAFLGLMAALTLLCPIYGAGASPFSPGVIAANVSALLFLASALIFRRLEWRRDLLGAILLCLLLAMNGACFYYNWTRHRWFWGQAHLTVSFLAFLGLLYHKEGSPIESEGLVKAILALGTAAALGCLAAWRRGIWQLSFANGELTVFHQKSGGLCWVFNHKSELAFMMVLFLALFVTYRRLFRHKILFYLGVAALTACLIASNTYTAMAGAVLIPLGLVLDRLFAGKRFRARYLLWLVPIAVGALLLLRIISRERNIMTLGTRTFIWRDAWKVIWENPAGVGPRAAIDSFPVDVNGGTYYVTNCHNVFLNWMYQYSVPAGLCCVGMFFTILAFSFRGGFRFTTLGIWGALLLSMTMDWCVLPQQLTLTLVCLYLLFFSPLARPKASLV